MVIPSYLTQRGKQGIYYVRLRIPSDLVTVFNRKEFIKSLKTSDLKTAQRLARPRLDEWEQSFDLARMKVDLTSDDLMSAAKEHYERELKADEAARGLVMSPSEKERQKAEAAAALRKAAKEGKFEWDDRLALFNQMLDHPVLFDMHETNSKVLDFRLSELRKQLAEGEVALVTYAADQFLELHQINLSKDDPAYRQLCMKLLRVEIEQLERVRERNRGDYSGQPRDTLFSEEAPKTFSTTTFEQIIDKQLRLSDKGIGRKKAPSTVHKYRTYTEEFVKWRKSGRVATVSKAEVERWRDILLDKHARKTVRDKVSTIRTVVEWGQKQSDGKLFEKRFPLDTIELPLVEKNDSAAKTYTLLQARKILTEARKQNQSYKRWIPWITAYSGARIEEVMQLESADFFEYEGSWFYHIRVGDGRTTKTGDDRKVPVHSALVEEGLINFVSSLPEGKLFRATRAAQNLRDWIREDVLASYPMPRPAPNHGFRHLFEDLRRARLDTEAANYITGRANPGSASTYGHSNVMLPALALQMERIERFL